MAFDFSELAKSKSTEDLKQIFSESHSYQPELAEAAATELNERNIDISELIIQRGIIAENEESRLSAGRKGNPFFILICFIASLLGGFAGVIGGYIYAFSKNRSNSGKSFYVYNKETRQFGKIIFGVGVVVFVAYILHSLNNYFGIK